MAVRPLKIAVIGVGGTGSSACRYLAKSGHKVTGFEKFQIGHEFGSSHGESRIIRYTYPDLLYTQMMKEAYALWAELEEESSQELVVRCGGLYLGPTEDQHLKLTESALHETRIPYVRMNIQQLESRFPAFRLLPGEHAIYQKESGFLRSSQCVAANVRVARNYGFQLLENTDVTHLLSHDCDILVKTEAGGEYLFDRVIVTAGAWMGRLLSELNLPLAVTRQKVIYLRAAQNSQIFEPDRFPVWIDTTHNFYGFPNDGVVHGIKIASHDHGAVVNPDDVDKTVDSKYIAEVLRIKAMRLPGLSDEVTYATTCLYTSTPDEHFIIDQVPNMPGVCLVSGCSGHGFKFTTLLGKIASEMATGTGHIRELSRFSLQRFQ